MVLFCFLAPSTRKYSGKQQLLFCYFALAVLAHVDCKSRIQSQLSPSLTFRNQNPALSLLNFQYQSYTPIGYILKATHFIEEKAKITAKIHATKATDFIIKDQLSYSYRKAVQCCMSDMKNTNNEMKDFSLTDDNQKKQAKKKNSNDVSLYDSETGCSQFDDREKTEFACGLIGADVELGLFDPFGLSKGKTEKEMKYYREAELVHGRIAMVAIFGWLVPDSKVFLPSLTEGTSISNKISKFLFGVSSLNFQETDPIKAIANVPFQLWLNIAFLISAAEIYRYFRTVKGNYEPGDLNLDPYGLTLPLMEVATTNTDWEGSVPKFRGDRFGENALQSRIFNLEPKGQRIIKVAEIKHGRLAMVAIVGLIAQYLVSGQSFCEQMHSQYGFTAFR